MRAEKIGKMRMTWRKTFRFVHSLFSCSQIVRMFAWKLPRENSQFHIRLDAKAIERNMKHVKNVLLGICGSDWVTGQGIAPNLAGMVRSKRKRRFFLSSTQDIARVSDGFSNIQSGLAKVYLYPLPVHLHAFGAKSLLYFTANASANRWTVWSSQKDAKEINQREKKFKFMFQHKCMLYALFMISTFHPKVHKIIIFHFVSPFTARNSLLPSLDSLDYFFASFFGRRWCDGNTFSPFINNGLFATKCVCFIKMCIFYTAKWLFKLGSC